jgi:hypothetical protein
VSRALRTTLALLAALAPSLGAGPAAAASDPELALVGLGVLEGEGWHAANEFRLEWEGPAGGPAQQVLAVDYLIRDAAGAVVVPTVRVEKENPTGVGHVQVPPRAGEYTAEVWLEGVATAGPRAHASLRFDPVPPGPARPLVPSGWVRAGLPVPIALEHPAQPWPRSGIRGYAIAVGDAEGPEPCAGPAFCAEQETDLAHGPGDDAISIGPLPEGTSFVRAFAVSGAGLRSEQVATAELKADGTGPTVALDPVPGGWSNGPVEVTARAHDALSGMNAGGPAGARTEIAVDGATASLAPGPVARAVVGGEGVHRLTASARDAVGNPSAARGRPPAAAATALLRVDESPPQVAFAAHQDPREPERIEALLTDALAGPDPQRGSIAIRPKGSRVPFRPLPTVVAPGRLLAVWDSDSYPAGTYEFEAVGYDAAGNRTVAARRVGGTAMSLTAPLKGQTALATGFGGRRAVSQRCTRAGGTVRCRRRRVEAYDRRPARRATRYGQRVAVGGRLSTATGAPLAGEQVEVVESLDPGAEPGRRESSALTAGDGTFLVRLPPGPSRRIRVEFAGTPLLGRTVSRTLRLAVRAPVRLRASAASATVGGPPIVFSGSVGHARASLPREGLELGLQFRIGTGPWTEFRTVRTDARGRFRYPYAFADDDSRGVRFQFRAVLGRAPGWPYAASASLPVLVTGR